MLVRVFEFQLRNKEVLVFPEFADDNRRIIRYEKGLQYREDFSDFGLGGIWVVHILCPKISKSDAEQLVMNGRIKDVSDLRPIDFIVQDLRNGGTCQVSTDPDTTTSYFMAGANSLPYEASPAYFRSGVILKYTGDREKYTVLDDSVRCRGGWSLRSYSVNDAGQIAVYICDLRRLPYEEQQHWATFNEPPKAGLPKRAIDTDFRGQISEDLTPREELTQTLQEWKRRDVPWWTWRDQHSPDLLTVPLTDSRDEWGAALVALSNCLIEGFD